MWRLYLVLHLAVAPAGFVTHVDAFAMSITVAMPIAAAAAVPVPTTSSPTAKLSATTTFISNTSANTSRKSNEVDHFGASSSDSARAGTGADGGGSSTRSADIVAFATLDKEVVDNLIRQWAPVVWLAPEEKFMPLGVEEFLNHVHPMDKGKILIPGMPIGDDSKKAYLVTNAKVDELLENENSFLYGRNPNESPVPIYAVVKLCHENCSSVAGAQHTESAAIPTVQLSQRQKLAAQIQPHSIVATSTRGPYIPVSINPLEDRNDTVRRSSRLYPVFKRVRRDGADATLAAAYMTPQLHQNAKPITPNYKIVTGEKSFDGTGSDGFEGASGPAATTDPTGVNNFIANLVDNVKFSIPDDELKNHINFENSFNDPISADHSTLTQRQKLPSFYVTYWMFYPYSQGKTMCTLSLGPLGSIPFPAVYGFCLGRRRDIGSHIGDWEHMSLFFDGSTEPTAMYVSAHDAGAYYIYNHLTGSFEFKKQETRKGILQRPNFPKTVTTFNNHPVLFAAKGSHGLWTAPGKHRFVKVARLYDINGFGTPWNTWKAVDITYENIKSYGRSLMHTWLSFKGKWGNPKNKCHPFRRIGLNFCEYTDGPTGIPLKEPHFECGGTSR